MKPGREELYSTYLFLFIIVRYEVIVRYEKLL